MSTAFARTAGGTMNRRARSFALALGACALAALAGCQERAGEAAPPVAAAPVRAPAPAPNVIVMMADDLGYADVSAYGIDRIPTPNIDSIGEGGVIFTAGYATASVCSPSRAGAHTGRYQQRYGFEYNAGPARREAEEGLGLDIGEITLGTALSGAGYATGLVGKWHLGSQDQFYPTNRGYADFVGIMPGGTAYIDITLPGVKHFDNPRPAGDVPRSQGRSDLTAVIEGPERTVIDNETEYLTEYWARRAVGFIEEKAPGDPYYLFIGWNAPHDPLTVTQKYYDRFPHIETEHHRIYAAMVSALDDAVGEVLAAVERSGEARDTLIVFVSDNGCAAYYDGMCACEPLRGGKLTHYEGGLRIPYMMKYPARLPAGQVYRQPVSTLDIFPTAMAAAGAPLATDRVYDGVDLLPFLTGEAEGEPHPVLAWRREPMAAIRQGDWKLWRSVEDGYSLLFNLAEDPNETTNLAQSHPEKLAELEAAFDAWAADMTDARWPSRPPANYTVCGVPFRLPI
jgi:arylsulfatase A-like enzyme